MTPAIDDYSEAVKKLADNLQVAFPQETITAFGSPLFALQYAGQHSKEIGLVLSAMLMRLMDGITLAQSMKNDGPGMKKIFVVQTENSELAAIARQHGNRTCFPRPATVESNRLLTKVLPVGGQAL